MPKKIDFELFEDWSYGACFYAPEYHGQIDEYAKTQGVQVVYYPDSKQLWLIGTKHGISQVVAHPNFPNTEE